MRELYAHAVHLRFNDHHYHSNYQQPKRRIWASTGTLEIRVKLKNFGDGVYPIHTRGLYLAKPEQTGPTALCVRSI